MAKRRSLRFFLAASFLLFIGLILFQGIRFGLYAVRPTASESTEIQLIEVSAGMTGYDLARKLRDEGIINDVQRFIWLGRLRGDWKKLKAGEYELSGSMSPLEIFNRVTSGISVQYPVTIREGQNLYEIAEAVASRNLATKEELIQLAKDSEFIRSLGFDDPLPPSLEGYLFPDTYYFPRKITAKQILTRMVQHLNRVWTEDFTRRAAELGMNQHQVLTLASIIEKETGAPFERKLVSSVFHNRLNKRMRLQSDPTTIYGMWETYSGNIKKEHLTTPSPYNTYTLPALPIGPIGNPGKDSIEAALFPEESEYFYFVSRNDGTHVFSKTYKEHLEAVRKFQLDRRAREGKSWRDLHKRSQQTSQ